MMPWQSIHRADPRAAALADRHYSRRTVGSVQFAPPGRFLGLLTLDGRALWVSLWQRPEYQNTAHPAARGGWQCTLFRNEGSRLSSDLITAAVAATRWTWGSPPAAGFVTFVNPHKVRRKRDPGRCFRRAGWEPIGQTARGLLILRLAPEAITCPMTPIGAQPDLFSCAQASRCSQAAQELPE